MTLQHCLYLLGGLIVLSAITSLITILVLKNSTFRTLKKEVKNGETFIDKAWLENNDKKDKMKNYLESHGYVYAEKQHRHDIIGVGKINYFNGTEKYQMYTSKVCFADCDKKEYEQAKKGELKTIIFENETTKGWFK